MLNWADRFNICAFLDNHHYHLPHGSVECLLGAGSEAGVTSAAGTAFAQLREFYEKEKDWMFGHLAYDLKNETEALSSANFDGIGFPDLFFFVPTVVVKLSSTELIIGSRNNDHRALFEEIVGTTPRRGRPLAQHVEVRDRLTKKEYLETVARLKEHILRGDCYEINFCQEFYARNAPLSPLDLYISLSEASPNPFSAYYRLNEKYVLCLSPERYLKKTGARVISQPIKGTARRYTPGTAEDQASLLSLQNSGKERSENIMIVDLVRNDLSKICAEASVHVDELCKVYSFPQVHQMISTISGQTRPGMHWTEVIRASFPMGSMTGAPKKKVMELIERYEVNRRGLFSGSIGYVTPDGDFDLNVVIRSLLYNAATEYLSFMTGSAITFNSDPETEYEECLLKAAAIKKALAETNTFH